MNFVLLEEIFYPVCLKSPAFIPAIIPRGLDFTCNVPLIVEKLLKRCSARKAEGYTY